MSYDQFEYDVNTNRTATLIYRKLMKKPNDIRYYVRWLVGFDYGCWENAPRTISPFGIQWCLGCRIQREAHSCFMQRQYTPATGLGTPRVTQLAQIHTLAVNYALHSNIDYHPTSPSPSPSPKT